MSEEVGRMNDKVGRVDDKVERVSDSVQALSIETRHGLFQTSTAVGAGKDILKHTELVGFASIVELAESIALATTPQPVLSAAVECAEAMARAGGANEERVQQAVVSLLQRLSKLTGCTLAVHDTHARSLLRHPESRIDVSLTVKGQSEALWSNLVVALELKADLSSAPQYHACISQIYERARYMFQQQPNRLFVVAGVADATQVEFWRLDRMPGAATVRRTRRAGTNLLDATAQGEGYVALLNA